MNYETVGTVEGTVAFIEATDFLKRERNLTYGEIAKSIGLSRSQLDMIRIKRRYINRQELDKLLKQYPEAKQFFEQPSLSDKVEESMILYSDGKAWKELAETQKKLIERIETENSELKVENEKLKSENKTLKEIIIDRTKPT